MKLLFDQNLASRLVVDLQTAYPDSQHVRNLNMDMASDEIIWHYAKENWMTIVSKDSDFFYRSMYYGHPPKVVWIKLGNCKTGEILDLLLSRRDDLLAFDSDNEASFLALS